MAGQGSITRLIIELRERDSSAAEEELWRRYYKRLVRLAATKLKGTSRRVVDEEDVVVDAFDSFFRGVELGRFPRLNDRDDLWQVLVMLASRKAANQIKLVHRQKRGGGSIRGDSGFGAIEGEATGIEDVAGLEPTPQFAEQVREELEELLAKLDDPSLRQVAVAKLEGYTNAEISARMGILERTVERKLQVIRRLWSANEPFTN